MKLYNTLTRQIEDIVPLNPPVVRVYTCGPTVYDYPHIGNWFTYIREDTLIRALKLAGYQPKWVMNITDVGHLVSDADDGEDKLEKGAKREGKTAWQVAEFYTDYFIRGMRKLNILTPDYLPKATDHIAEQISMIQILEEKGFTYTITDGVYFDATKFPRYADFARLDLDEQQAGARVEYNSEKRNPQDFALWKFSPSGQKRDMEWESPWGKGFPGWHIECSAMSIKYLGETIDIHAGGIDHIPVHHSNEIAQSESATGKQFAKYWLHTNHIMIDNDKISKSLQNGITLEDIENKGFSIDAFRLHVLESHYRSQSKFSWESLEAAQNRLAACRAVSALQYQTISATGNESKEFASLIEKDITRPLMADLNTPQLLAIVSQRLSEFSETLISDEERAGFVAYLRALDDVLGINLSEEEDITSEQKTLIGQRDEARRAKDYEKSDTLRQRLEDQGIGIRDTPVRTIWHRLS